MLPHFGDLHANASSLDHAAGAAANSAVELARSEVARLIGAAPNEIIFTSGATEANNIAVLGTLQRSSSDGEVLVGATEHPAVLGPASTAGDRVRLVPVDNEGVIDLAALRRLLTPRTALVAVMAANNETGVIQPLAEISALCVDAGVPLHVDGAQAAGRVPLNVETTACATLAISGHKMHGPQGVGALYLRGRRPRSRVTPIQFGGGQERDLRPGTLNVPGIVGLGEAARLVRTEMSADTDHAVTLAGAFRDAASGSDVELVENVRTAPRLPQTLSIRFPGVRAVAVIREVAGELAVSTGSACATMTRAPSHVLTAQGLSDDAVRETIRVSFGRTTTIADVRQGGVLLRSAAEGLTAFGRAA